MPARHHIFLFAALIALFNGCSGNIGVPPLPRAGEPIDRILMRGKLEPKDIRELFRLLNENGNLHSLKPWIEDATDEELRMVGSFIGRHFYENAYQRDGLRSLLDLRIDRRGFSQWEFGAKQTPDLRALVPLLSLKNLSALLSRDAGFLSRQFFETISDLKTQAPLGVDPDAMAEEALRFLGEKENQKRLIPLTASLLRSEFGKSLLLALKELREKYANDSALRGFARSIKNNLKPEDNRWNAVLDLARLLNRPTNGLFLEAQKSLRESSDLARHIEMKIRPKVAAAVATYLRAGYAGFDAAFWRELPRKNASDAPTANFATLFTRTREAVEKIISSELATEEPFLYQRRVLLSSFVITEWLEALAAQNPNAPEQIEKGTYQFPSFSLELRGETAGTLSPKVAGDLKAIAGEAIAPFLKDLTAFVWLSGAGKTTYQTPALPKKTPFAVGLREALTDFDRTISLGDATPLFASLFSSFTHPEHPLDLSLAAFETDSDGSMLRSVHRFLGALTYDGLERLFHLLFEDLDLDNMEEDDKATYCGVFSGGSENARFCLRVLEDIRLIPLFNQRIEGLPSLVETYHALLTYTIPKRSGGAEDLLSFLSSSLMFASEGNRPIYPTVFRFFQNEDLVTEILARLSSLSDDKRDVLLNTLTHALEERNGVSGVALHLKAMEEIRIMGDQRPRRLLAFAIRRGGGFLPDEKTLTFDERASLERLAEGDDLREFIPFLQSHGSLAGALAFSRELRALSQSGALRETLELLGRTENERLRLLATTLLKWETSGESAAFLNTMESLIGG